jgi:hypothetical protein
LDAHSRFTDYALTVLKAALLRGGTILELAFLDMATDGLFGGV